MKIFVLLVTLQTVLICAWADNENISGMATWYENDNFFVREETANGEIVDEEAMTCATRPLIPFGTVLRVTNAENGKSVFVRVNDRMPPRQSPVIIDLTKKAFSEIEDPETGIIKVVVENVYPG